MKPTLRQWSALLLAVAGTSWLASCKKQDASAPSIPAIDVSYIDTTCAACTDFYQYANGAWLKTATIKPEYSYAGVALDVSERNQELLHTILEKDAKDAVAGSLEKASAGEKVGLFYAACMDTVTIDAQGAKPLQPLLDSVAALNSSADLIAALPHLEHQAGLMPIGNGPEQDPGDATTMIAGIGQSGLSLPERDYYFRMDPASKEIRDKFVAHMTAMFALLGDDAKTAAAEASAVLSFETKLAKASRKPEELRDPHANYHRMSVAEATKNSPHFDWANFYAVQQAPAIPAVDVGQPEFLKNFDAMLTGAPMAEWKAYLRWRVAHDHAYALSSPFVMENFKFTQLFSGQKMLRPRWKRCSSMTDAQLGELLGQEYVKTAFPPEAKDRALKMVGNLVDALHDRITGLQWMDAATKTQALAKLASFTRKIGYPDKWRDYSALTINKGEYLADLRAAERFETQRQWNKIGKPVDRTEWGMTPPTVNAYYNPQLNEIVFPAGILQPPFFNPNADDAVNYGSMGAVIGHEMTHGFDDEGRQFDKDGNLKDWWTAADAAKYTVEANKVVAQFSAYTVIDTMTHVNGKLTLGENIADFGGVTVAYAAMEKAIGSGTHAKIDNFTPEQRFFIAYAQSWLELDRDESMKTQINSDPHSPPKWRVNGPLSNMPEFKAAWGCKDTDKMVRPAAMQPKIW